jgi:nucleoside 2-deoxyribosyltransferase
MLARDGPPLYVAAKLGCVAATRVMCEAGTHLEVLGPRRERPLHAAAANGHTNVAATLVSAGCEIDPQDEDGNTPLITAVLNGQAGPVELLLAVGADMDVARLDGMTAVHLAQLPGTPKVIYDLMMLGQEEHHRVSRLARRMKLYLAGPDVFRPDAARWAARSAALCAAAGHLALVPLDAGGVRRAAAIYAGNLRLITEADCVLANLNPFRGAEPDSGTCVEIGYALALGKRVVGYADDLRPLRDRLQAGSGDGAAATRRVGGGGFRPAAEPDAGGAAAPGAGRGRRTARTRRGLLSRAGAIRVRAERCAGFRRRRSARFRFPAACIAGSCRAAPAPPAPGFPRRPGRAPSVCRACAGRPGSAATTFRRRGRRSSAPRRGRPAAGAAQALSSGRPTSIQSSTAPVRSLRQRSGSSSATGPCRIQRSSAKSMKASRRTIMRSSVSEGWRARVSACVA